MPFHQGQSKMLIGMEEWKGGNKTKGIRTGPNLSSHEMQKKKGSRMTEWIGKKRMTRAHAINSPFGARGKPPKKTPHKHSICTRIPKMCSHLLHLWCRSGESL